jgi:hypothetical protein
LEAGPQVLFPQVVAMLSGVQQVPFRQAWPGAQAAPVLPQTQTPLLQVSAELPQLTQFGPQAVGSVSLGHASPHGWKPWAQVNAQEPRMQAAVALSGLGQSAPVQQSVAGMQVSPQPFCPVGQQRPPAQLPEAHWALRSQTDPSSRSPTQLPALQ